MWIFGERWDAPVCDDAERYPVVPTYAKCIDCDEQIQEGDQGFVQVLMLGSVDPDYLVGLGANGVNLIAIHRECQLLGILGHSVGVCSCTGWDTSRASAREALRRVQDIKQAGLRP